VTNIRTPGHIPPSKRRGPAPPKASPPSPLIGAKNLPEPANPALGRPDGTKRPLFVQNPQNVETYDIELD
jgi:hypothetical protein